MKAVVPLAGSLLIPACSNPSTTALGTNVPLAPAPDLAGAGTPGVLVWRSPDLAAQERMASAYLIPPATVYRGRGSYFADLSPQQVDDIAIQRCFQYIPRPGIPALQRRVQRLLIEETDGRHP